MLALTARKEHRLVPVPEVPTTSQWGDGSPVMQQQQQMSATKPGGGRGRETLQQSAGRIERDAAAAASSGAGGISASGTDVISGAFRNCSGTDVISGAFGGGKPLMLELAPRAASVVTQPSVVAQLAATQQGATQEEAATATVLHSAQRAEEAWTVLDLKPSLHARALDRLSCDDSGEGSQTPTPPPIAVTIAITALAGLQRGVLLNLAGGPSLPFRTFRFPLDAEAVVRASLGTFRRFGGGNPLQGDGLDAAMRMVVSLCAVEGAAAVDIEADAMTLLAACHGGGGGGGEDATVSVVTIVAFESTVRQHLGCHKDGEAVLKASLGTFRRFGGGKPLLGDALQAAMQMVATMSRVEGGSAADINADAATLLAACTSGSMRKPLTIEAFESTVRQLLRRHELTLLSQEEPYYSPTIALLALQRGQRKESGVRQGAEVAAGFPMGAP